LIWVYFKDEPDFVKIIEDDDEYEKIYGKLWVYMTFSYWGFSQDVEYWPIVASTTALVASFAFLPS
jgi:hypothetical protein